MKALERLQADYTGFLEAVTSSTAMRPYAHALRCLLDPRPHEERIDAAVREHHGAFKFLPRREQTYALQRRLAAKLTMTSLEEAPCDKAVRQRLRSIWAEENRNLAKQTPHALVRLSTLTTIAST